MKKTLSFSRNPRPWRTNPKIHGFPDFQGGVRNLDLSSKGFWSRGWRPRVKLVHPHTSPYSCSSPRSTRVQSRDTSGSSFWFIQISSLVASLMNSTRFLRCRMRFTEFVCKRKVGKTFNSNIILLWFTLIKLYNNICMCGPLFQNLAVSSLEVAHNLNISQVFISQVYVPPSLPHPWTLTSHLSLLSLTQVYMKNRIPINPSQRVFDGQKLNKIAKGCTNFNLLQLIIDWGSQGPLTLKVVGILQNIDFFYMLVKIGSKYSHTFKIDHYI